MDFSLNNSMVQKQLNTITPKMVEELKILQMSNIELENYIEIQLTENPLLDLENNEDSEMAETNQCNTDFYNEYEYYIKETFSEKKDFTEYSSAPVTLKQFLLSQIREIIIPDRNKNTIIYLIENINDDGYLNTTVSEIARDLKVSEKVVRQSLKIVQELEPAGLGARNLKECIWLQLLRKGQVDDNITNVIKNHLKPLAKRKYNEISAETGLTRDKIIEIHSIIKQTYPKPGQGHSNEKMPEYIKPELIVQQVNTDFIVFFNYEWNIDLKVNNYYKKILGAKDSSKEVNKYINTKLSKAMEIVQAVKQRKKTILDVATFIINYQADYFYEGYMKLKSLTMKIVADNVGLHESTISRTVNGKYIQTPKGIFELKYFFSSQIETENSFVVSTNAVKKVVKEIIQNEDKSKPFSDEEIKCILEKKGFKIARRTVAKYRQELNILTASLRRVRYY